MNSSVFKTSTLVKNNAGGNAHALTSKEVLAQIAVTGTFNNTYYASGQTQLDLITEHASKVDAEFIAKLAIYARHSAFMKDTPAVLLAILVNKDTELFKRVFNIVVTDGKILKNFVKVMRSGAINGRKSLGTCAKKAVKNWLNNRNPDQVVWDSIGNDPSLSDVIKMVHPNPQDTMRSNLYSYLIGKDFNVDFLPSNIKAYELFKSGKSSDIPNVPFQKLDSLNLSVGEWKEVFKNASWQMTRMNLNTALRQCVLDDPSMVKLIANRLRDPDQVKSARNLFPYQILNAYMNINPGVPMDIKNALQDAMEIATENIERIDGGVIVCPDVSASMSQSVTGSVSYGSPQSSVQCVDVAALIAASYMRVNQNDCNVIPFEHRICDTSKLNPRDSVMTNANYLSKMCGGGTNCSLALKHANDKGMKANAVIFVSDNESWMDNRWGNKTAMENEWKIFKKNNPEAKLICIDITPNNTTQAKSRNDVLNVGGFSDNVFNVINGFTNNSSENFVKVIDGVRF